jgi:hypothetical protein
MATRHAPSSAERHALYLRDNLRKVQSGRLRSAPGIRKCPDCHGHYIADDAPVPYCRACRVNHTVTCRDCGTHFPCDVAGSVTCKSCRDQTTLF